MNGRVSILALSFAIGACSHMPERPLFATELVGADSSECPSDPPITHLLWSRYCDIQSFSTAALARAERHAQAIDLKNAITFAAGAYIGTTVLLNPNGLSPIETTDQREAVVGVTALQLTSQVYNPIASRDRNVRAYHAYSCVGETTRLALHRQVFVHMAEDVLAQLRDKRRQLQALVDTGQITPATKERANASITAADEEIARAEPQIRAYYNFPTAVEGARNAIHAELIQASLREDLALATLVQAMTTTFEQNLAFREKGEEAPEATDTARTAAGDEGAAGRLITDIADGVSRSQQVTPNMTTLAANLGQCAAVIGTGVRPAPPVLADVGNGELPGPTDPFFSALRRAVP